MAALETGGTPMPELRLKTVEMHTGGEPVRIVVEGYPAIEGESLLDKRRFARDHLDHLRRLLVFEPRGHFDMYGALLVEPDLPEADLGVLFMHNEGYSTMCGHAVIALGRYAVDRRLVTPREPETEVRIQCPCGLVTAHVEVQGGRSGHVRFESVPAFAHTLDATVEVPGHGQIILDIGYGGAFYALLPAATFNLDLRRARTRDLVDAASAVSEAVKVQVPLSHPDDPELAFLYGTILTDGRGDDPSSPSANICVFADRQVDRSPTGSGVTARMALLHRKGLAGPGAARTFESVTGSRFAAKILRETSCGPNAAVVVEVSGRAHYTGEAAFTCEDEDEIGRGFLLR
jgi:trans-L-3-hydroxyproline dehydratase